MKVYAETVLTDTENGVAWVARKYTPNPDYDPTIASEKQDVPSYIIEEQTGINSTRELARVDAQAAKTEMLGG